MIILVIISIVVGPCRTGYESRNAAVVPAWWRFKFVRQFHDYLRDTVRDSGVKVADSSLNEELELARRRSAH